jgi:hypothetical protein
MIVNTIKDDRNKTNEKIHENTTIFLVTFEIFDFLVLVINYCIVPNITSAKHLHALIQQHHFHVENKNVCRLARSS